MRLLYPLTIERMFLMIEEDWNEREERLTRRDTPAAEVSALVEVELFDRSEAPRGFAALLPQTRAVMAARGGKKAHASGNGHTFTSAEARAAGLKGVRIQAEKRKAAAQ
jgi:hypothetical protein